MRSVRGRLSASRAEADFGRAEMERRYDMKRRQNGIFGGGRIAEAAEALLDPLAEVPREDVLAEADAFEEADEDGYDDAEEAEDDGRPAWVELWPEAATAAEAEALHQLYPGFDPAGMQADPVLGPYLRGEARPTLRRLYEAAHLEEIVAERVEATVSDAVATAVEEALRGARESAESHAAEAAEQLTAAVRESEERLLGHIRARGRRPAENGVRGESGIRLHPAVERLTRRDRAILASRAERGETIRL